MRGQPPLTLRKQPAGATPSPPPRRTSHRSRRCLRRWLVGTRRRASKPTGTSALPRSPTSPPARTTAGSPPADSRDTHPPAASPSPPAERTFFPPFTPAAVTHTCCRTSTPARSAHPTSPSPTSSSPPSSPGTTTPASASSSRTSRATRCSSPKSRPSSTTVPPCGGSRCPSATRGEAAAPISSWCRATTSPTSALCVTRASCPRTAVPPPALRRWFSTTARNHPSRPRGRANWMRR